MNTRMISLFLALAAVAAATARAERTPADSVMAAMPANSLVDAHTDSLLKSHRIVYIDGQPAGAT